MNKAVAIAEQAVMYLESIEGPEKNKAIDAATVLRDALSKVASNPKKALSDLVYGLAARAFSNGYGVRRSVQD